jgi:hypothetical protein
MKRLFIAVILSLAVLPVFAQDAPPSDDPYAKFQGIWYGVIYDEDKVFFVFIDDIFICNLDGGYYYKYNIEGQNIVIKNARELLVSGWGDTEYNPDTTNSEWKIQYVFSGKRLVLVFGGEPITLSTNPADFPEWDRNGYFKAQ